MGPGAFRLFPSGHRAIAIGASQAVFLLLPIIYPPLLFPYAANQL